MTKSDESQMTGDELQNRLSAAGARIVELVDEFPDTRSGRHVAEQLLRSATAPGAHYGEARGAHSRKDFIHKVSLAAKEVREAEHWMQIARDSGLLERRVENLREALSELRTILSCSLKTARENRSS